ncbi:pseudouridine synthase [Nocardiopsis dassonvillei]|uniref:pseudouridine synthase n=1 Tax=Nocardiopsis dassonvillei TaxID=2014 RepID=UPI00363CAC55
MSTPNNSSRGARDDAPRGERGDYDKRGGQGRGDSRDRRDDRPRGGYRDDRGPRGRDDRGGFRSDRDDRGGRDFRGGRDGQRGEGRSFGGDRDGRRSFSGGRDDRGGRDFRGGRDDRDRGGFRSDRGPGGGRDDRDRGGFRGDRDSRGGRDFRGGRDGQRGEGRSFGGGRDDRRSFGDRDNRGGRDSRGPGGVRDLRDGGDRDGRPGGDRSGAKRVTSENQLSKAARERLSALRADYDPRDEDRADEARDTYTDVENGIRLQKALAAAGVASRRASEEMIAAGRVSVDGQVVRRFGARVDPEASEIRVDGMRVVTAPDKLYFALNKPRGVVSTMWDPEGRPTLADYTGQTEERIFHVGRLDTETEGLILLTNDGELANRLTHPRYKVVKTYIAKVPGPVPHRVVREVQKGVELEDGPVEVDSFRVVDNEPPKALVEIRLHEGRKHIVRRLMEAVGHPVADLARTQVGPIDLNALKLGTMRALTSREVSELYEAAGL